MSEIQRFTSKKKTQHRTTSYAQYKKQQKRIINNKVKNISGDNRYKRKKDQYINKVQNIKNIKQ